MKKYFLEITMILIHMVFVFNLTSCQEFNIDSQTEYPLHMDCDAQSTYEVMAISPSDIVFNISSNTPWKITSSADWCTADPAMSSISSLVRAVTIHVEDNQNETPRSATLTVKADGLEKDVIITINQESKGVLYVQPVDDIVPAVGGKTTFTITSNKDWKVISEKQWISFDQTEGKGTGEIVTIQAIVSANEAGKRSSIVTISTGLEERTFELKQDGMMLEFVKIDDEKSKYFNGHGIEEPRIFSVMANVDWNVECKEDWVEVLKVDDKHISVRIVKDNSIFKVREAHINLVPVGISTSALFVEPLTISQGTCFKADVISPSTSETDKSGALTLVSTQSKKCRYYTNGSDYKLGTYIWKFSNVSFADPFIFDVNFYNEKGGARFELFLGKALLTNTLGTWGTHDWWSENKFDVTLDDMNAMRTLKIEFLKKENNPNIAILKVTLNNRILVSIEKVNPFQFSEMDYGNTIYFGFNGSHFSDAHVTIDSFEVIPQK